MEDDRIVDLYWARNEQAIAESERKYGRLLRSVSYACLGSREDAEECANDTYLEAWNAMPTARPQFLGAFLSKITRRISIDRFRRDHRTKRGGAEALTAELTDCLPDPAEPTPCRSLRRRANPRRDQPLSGGTAVRPQNPVRQPLFLRRIGCRACRFVGTVAGERQGHPAPNARGAEKTVGRGGNPAMKQQPDRRAQNLLDAMGGIDDRFLVEAIEAIAAQRKRRRPKRLPRILAVAAALALVVGIGLAGGRLLHGILFPNREPTPDGSSDAPADFSALLLACTGSDAFREQSAALPLAADGNVRIVVGERGGENLWVSRALTDTERTAVRREMESAKRQSAYETAGTDRYLVWVADGDGAVWSPALTYSGGNVTYGTVYDYDPERLPGTAFQNLLSGLIG